MSRIEVPKNARGWKTPQNERIRSSGTRMSFRDRIPDSSTTRRSTHMFLFLLSCAAISALKFYSDLKSSGRVKDWGKRCDDYGDTSVPSCQHVARWRTADTERPRG